MLTLNEIEEIARERRGRYRWGCGMLIMLVLVTVALVMEYIIRHVAPGQQTMPLMVTCIAACVVVAVLVYIPKQKYRSTRRRLRKANGDVERRELRV